MENSIQNAIDRAGVLARSYGAEMITGASVIQRAKESPAPRNIAFAMFAEGDVVEIPAWPVENQVKETDKQWMLKPISRGGSPVLSVLCKVTNANGIESYKELFAGTLVKNALNNETKQNVASSGSVPQAVRDCATVADVFMAVAGKKIKFSNPTTFQTVRRDFSGNRPDRLADTTVFQIDFV